MRQMFHIIKSITCITIYGLMLTHACFAQTLPDIQNSLKHYAENNLQEKLYVHTDRQDYVTGEIIWFKVYAEDGFYNKPLDLSKVAYVEILDGKQNPVMQAKIALRGGSGSGSLLIPVSVNSGNYRFRAYTSWMKNFSPEYYFQKTIRIVNPQKASDENAKEKKAETDVQFFPEGGNLVSGLKNRVAFKAVGPDGLGVDFKGAIINQFNDTLVRFSSLKFGMGSFLFTPDKNHTYKAIIRIGNKKLTKELPVIANDGYTMQVTENAGQLDVAVSGNGQAGTIYILVHTRQVLKLAKEVSLNNGTAHFMLDKNLLGEGISQITIFNSDRQPVCERLYFKKPTAKLLIDARPDQQLYSRRNKVSIAVQAKDGTGIPLGADLSMAVYKVDDFETAPTGDDILSYLWLSSDLQGNIESSGYYFSNDTDATVAADNLMLTQGWRRFEWKDVLANKHAAFRFLPEIDGHIVEGKIVNTATNEPAKGIITYLAVQGKRVQLFVAESDPSGRLLFNTKDLNSSEIVVQPNTEQDSIYRIDILKPFSEEYSKTPVPVFDLKDNMETAIRQQNLAAQVLKTYAAGKMNQVYDPAVDSSGFFKRPTTTYLLDDYTRFVTMEEVLREYVKEVNITRQRNRFHIKVISENGFLDGDPLVLIDGLPVFDINKVMATDPLVIKKLAIVPQTYFYGPSVQQGVFSFTSYNGNVGSADINPHALVVDYEGLQMQRVFYSPVYETQAQVKSRIPDFRKLLFWSPSVKANGGPVSFYTSDQQGQYIGIVQGITASGEAASTIFTFRVRK